MKTGFLSLIQRKNLIKLISENRGLKVPDTDEQVNWIQDFYEYYKSKK